MEAALKRVELAIRVLKAGLPAKPEVITERCLHEVYSLFKKKTLPPVRVDQKMKTMRIFPPEEKALCNIPLNFILLRLTGPESMLKERVASMRRSGCHCPIVDLIAPKGSEALCARCDRFNKTISPANACESTLAEGLCIDIMGEHCTAHLSRLMNASVSVSMMMVDSCYEYFDNTVYHSTPEGKSDKIKLLFSGIVSCFVDQNNITVGVVDPILQGDYLEMSEYDCMDDDAKAVLTSKFFRFVSHLLINTDGEIKIKPGKLKIAKMEEY
jgi:hypothetical protein